MIPEDLAYIDRIEYRFFSHVQVTDGCWEWTGVKIKDSYGRDSYGRFRLNGKMVLAHRVSYELFVGAVPDGLCVCHKCDNPGCVNPSHLFVGTAGDNLTDSWNKKRRKPWDQRGERNPNSRLSGDQVKEIRGIYQSGDITQEKLAQLYGVSRANISYIMNRTWKGI